MFKVQSKLEHRINAKTQRRKGARQRQIKHGRWERVSTEFSTKFCRRPLPCDWLGLDATGRGLVAADLLLGSFQLSRKLLLGQASFFPKRGEL
ncbi:MAG: hypothetical protein C5B50_16520 [Verrucomicrobia bacterium]|nr:MAG: hypothetical protein C5B50_16520 [Verrucomicrobiota bacterium]